MIKYILIEDIYESRGIGEPGDVRVKRFSSEKALQEFLDGDGIGNPRYYEIYEVAKELEFSRVTITVREVNNNGND